MKKLLIAILIVCFMASTAFAGHHGRNFAIGMMLGAVTSAIIINHNRPVHYETHYYTNTAPRGWYYQQSRYPQRHYRHHHHHRSYARVCQNFPVRNQWGDIVRVDTYCK